MARRARCGWVRSGLAQEVKAIAAARPRIDAVCPKLTSGQLPFLGGCRAWSAESVLEERRSQNRPQRDQFLPDLQPNSRAIRQKAGEKWAAAVDLQPAISKSDSLLG